jgi:trypsin-like peptidase
MSNIEYRTRETHMLRSFRLLIAAVLWSITLAVSSPLPAQGTAATSITNAVVRIPSHGASATVIHTEQGRTLLLGCAHAYQGTDRFKPMTLDIPCGNPGPKKHVGVALVDLDYEADLSLLQLNDGPVDAFVTVAPAGYAPRKTLLSVGFDEMRLPATVRSASLLGSAGSITFTRERPWHGRSGGALLDAERGYLVGVVSGYEVIGRRRGMYVSHAAIVEFLARQQAGQGRTAPQPYHVPQPSGTPYGGFSTPLPYLCPPSG